MQKRFIILGAVMFGAACNVHAQTSFSDIGKELLKSQTGIALPSGSASTGGLGAGLSAGEIGAGLKDALKVAAKTVTNKLGVKDGFNADPAIHIPLPDTLKTIQQGMKMAGQSALMDDLELKLNRAAETATPKAKQLFIDAIQSMTLEDAKGILNGPKDSATQYFKRTMSPNLKTAMRPVIGKTVSESGAIKAYSRVTSAASALPIIGQTIQSGPDQLTDYVLDYALNGIFKYLGDEEAAIRSDPAKRTTELLKKVFGS